MVPPTDREFVNEVCPTVDGTLELDRTALTQFLAAPLVRPVPLRGTSYLFEHCNAGEYPAAFAVADDDTGHCQTLDRRFTEMFSNSSSATGSEDMVHGMVDSCLLHPLKAILEFASVPGVSFSRNQVAPVGRSSHTAGSRPDVYLWADTFLLLVGEEKKSGTDLYKATEDLEAKLDGWSPILMGETSFLLGFGVCGPTLCFYAYNDKVSPFAITPEFNLASQEGRFTLVPVLFQLAGLLRYQRSLAPPHPVALLKPIARQGGRVTITFHMTYVEVEYTADQEIHDLLVSLRRHPVESLIWPKTVRRSDCGRLRAEFQPVGLIAKKPTDEDGVNALLRCLLTALDGLHRLGWCHNDIRWPNVISHPTEPNRWILIDLDLASEFGKEVQLQGFTHTASVQNDLDLLRKMLQNVVDDPAILPQASFWDGSPTASDLLDML